MRGKGFDLYLADTSERQIRGLQFFDKVPEAGLLFETAQGQRFHSRNVKSEFEVVELDSKGEVLSIRVIASPKQEFAIRTATARYLIEFPEGFCNRKYIEIGDRIEWKK